MGVIAGAAAGGAAALVAAALIAWLCIRRKKKRQRTKGERLTDSEKGEAPYPKAVGELS